MATLYVPSKLVNICVRKVVENVNGFLNELSLLPEHVRDKLLYLLSKRGTLSDRNIGLILHSNLVDLDLSQSEITDEGLKELCRCKRLKKLDLNAGKGIRKSISSEGVIAVANHCRNLEVVFLRRCELINDSAILHLTRCCSNLTQLNVEGCHLVTDHSAASIAENSSMMKSLNLSRTQVTDKGLELISNGCCAETLFELHVSYCRDVTDSSIDMLVNCCPKLQILIFAGCPLTTNLSRESVSFLGRRMRQLSWTVY